MGGKRKSEEVVNDQILSHLFLFIPKRNLKKMGGGRTFILYSNLSIIL